MSEHKQTYHPAQALLDLIITLLTPMFLAAAGNNLDFARQAASETINAYRAENQSDLITVAKIIGFGLAALAAISLSMNQDLPITTILRLHASANASDRSEHRNRDLLKRSRTYRPAAPAEPDVDVAALTAAAAEMKQRTARHLAQVSAPAAVAEPAPAPASAPEPAAAPRSSPTAPERERQYQATWAASAAAIAAETAADLPNMPPDERAYAAIWVNVLNDCAKDFMAGDLPPRLHPGDLAGMMQPAIP